MNNFNDKSEWDTRCDLAACYRLCYHLGFTDRINTHISSRSKNNFEEFYLNPVGLLFDEVKASNLVRLNLFGKKVDKNNPYNFNEAGYMIHSAVLSNRKDINCVIHHHSIASMTVGALKQGLMFLTQHSLQFYKEVGYNSYNGFGLDINDEKKRLASDLGDHNILFMRNHGVLICGKTIGEAFCKMDDLEKACQTQIAILSTNKDIVEPSESVAYLTKSQYDNLGRPAGETEWPAMKRMLDRLGVEYKS
ncbi:MAG: Decarboxylase NovR [Alphaproteobacteria bacterium MarineAlpha2_Bin1]|nr:MAG: Decarboxylase NovR [Alphaproteobacteria bacterium MarineAlpha2_Bin1]|tara:strand:+ start:548 stop:1294 length:747 start_codon:yes stop_codon:yes gene_type:complete